MNVNLGCGNVALPGFVGLDKARHSPHVDIVHDLNSIPWPIEDDSVDRILCSHVLEHLDGFIPFFDEAWRILKGSGIIEIAVPHWRHQNAWIDPTHKRGYDAQSFQYLDPETGWGKQFAHVYTQRPWRIKFLTQTHCEVTAKLQPRKT